MTGRRHPSSASANNVEDEDKKEGEDRERRVARKDYEDAVLNGQGESQDVAGGSTRAGMWAFIFGFI